MTTQNYLIIESNVVTNIVVWDGNSNTWTPPTDSIQLVQASTPAMIWESNNLIPPSWELKEKMGLGNIGFNWNGAVLITNEPEPTVPPKITTTGTQTI